MDVRGWVYVISNESMPGLLKVGFSTKDPHLRARELRSSGIPHPYIVEYDALVRAPQALEQQIHKALKEKRERNEWFRCSLREAIETIRQLMDATDTTEVLSELAKSELAAGSIPPRLRGGLPIPEVVNRSSLTWLLSESSRCLIHKGSGLTFSPDKYYYDGGGRIKGFVVKDRGTPWISLDDVEIVD